MSTDGSVVELIYDVDGDDEMDITNYATITGARFSSASNASPGDCEVVLRDITRDLSFITGKRLKLRLDGQDMWSGFSLINGKSSFFPAGDGREETKARRWILRGVDNNVLLDKRVLRRPANYLKAVPNITSNQSDGQLLKDALADLFDMPSWVDIETYIDDVQIPSGGDITAADPWAWPQQGSKLRDLFEDLARWSAAVFYIGPDDAVHYIAVQDAEHPWGFSDRPNRTPVVGGGGFEGAYYGFREMNAEEDGQQLVTDAFVWGGSPLTGSGVPVFKRATDEDLEDIHGKWQMAETHFNETNYKTQRTVDQRANIIVFGNPTGSPTGAEPGTVVGEGPRGLRFSQWQYSFGWTTKDVPSISGVPNHLYPGNIVPIQLWAFSEDGGVTPFTKFLPLRALSITFPSGAKNGRAHVSFQGTFDLRNEDGHYLWRFLRRREPQISGVVANPVDQGSTDSPMGGDGTFSTVTSPSGISPLPNGSNTVFTIMIDGGTLPVGYIPGTLQLSLNGIQQTQPLNFTESDPDAGEFTTTFVPETGDNITVRCRTQAA